MELNARAVRFYSGLSADWDGIACVSRPDLAPPKPPRASVDVVPDNAVRRRTVEWAGGAADIVQATQLDRFEMRFHARVHLLIAYEQGARRSGEVVVGGTVRSTRKEVKRKLTFVPAGQAYSEWFEPQAPPHVMYVYLLPESVPFGPGSGNGTLACEPRLFFEHPVIWETMAKLKSLIERINPDDRTYIGAVGRVLGYELARLTTAPRSIESPAYGGLAAWQQRIVLDYIEENLAANIQLATLAKLVRLGPHHFCRAFKESLGCPPCRYHGQRRIERAKSMLVMPGSSVTEIGFSLGYSETSSFTAAFRRATGLTPTAFRRSLV